MDDVVRVVLVCEDEPTAESIARAIESRNERIDAASVASIDSALARLDRERVDCLVSASSLPDGDVLQLLERVRSDRPALPFVVYTEPNPVVEAAIEGGATGYVPRSDEVDSGTLLANRIEKAVERYRARREADSSRTTAGSASTADVAGDPNWILDQLFTQVPTHLYVKDDDGRYLYVSDYHVDNPEAQIGRTDEEIYPAPIGEAAYADDMRVIETGEPVVEKEEYAAFQNEWNLTSKVPWYDRSGEIAGLIGVTRRITGRKEYEEELERQNDRLEEFVEAVSHDLRNPLTVARGRLELLRDEYESEHFDAVERAHDRMETLVEDVLTLARDGNSDREVEPLDLDSVARRCWETVATRDATLEVDTDATVHADDQQLQQLLENLVRNAVEHGSTSPRSSPPHEDAVEHGGADVTVTVGDCADGFYVADDGVGIPPDERDRVFERGYSTTGEGTGFGLSIVTQIAERNDWRVRVVESDAGGARFEVTGVELDG